MNHWETSVAVKAAMAVSGRDALRQASDFALRATTDKQGRQDRQGTLRKAVIWGKEQFL
jgi:hypothetical protein